MNRTAATFVFLLFGACTWPACTLDFDIPGDVETSCSIDEPCVCEAGSTCSVDCGSGACSPTCEAGARCTIDCGSGVCSVRCDGSCAVDCGSGVCTCDGPGCPK